MLNIMLMCPKLCLKADCSIRVYSKIFNMMSVLLGYIMSIISMFYFRVITSMVSVLLEYIDLY